MAKVILDLADSLWFVFPPCLTRASLAFQICVLAASDHLAMTCECEVDTIH